MLRRGIALLKICFGSIDNVTLACTVRTKVQVIFKTLQECPDTRLVLFRRV